MGEYKDTIQLPDTGFDMRARLKKKEPALQERWAEEDLYGRIREARAGAPKYVLHDGPPYASGEIHIGTGMNKILKDVVVKYKTMQGFDAPYIPGWDCHGLPIERKVLDELGDEVETTDRATVRHRCEEFARRYLELGNEQFEALGILGRWEDPYLTMDPTYEAGVIDLFREMVEAGFVYRHRRPIHWCMKDETALAEAELEYDEKRSPSITCRFALDGAGLEAAREAFGVDELDDAGLLVWTTTPWTLDANMAVAVAPAAEYSLVRHGHDGEEVVSVLATDLVGDVLADRSPETLARCRGGELVGASYHHPWADRTGPVVGADHVSLEEGTGCVHTAPGHGVVDYETGQREGLEVRSPVGPNGVFTSEASDWLAGTHVFKANPVIVERLRETGHLLHHEEIVHSYPHCWRCKRPVIFRATAQWFVDVDRDDLRERSVEAVDGVRWVPDWGETRMKAMLEERPDWCISRQRAWGIPIPAFECRACGEVVLDGPRTARVRDFFAARGATAWFEAEPPAILGDLAACPSCDGELRGLQDIFDVWFESGSSWRAVCETEDELTFPADLYLEGTDQHRGWFQLSLLPAMIARGEAPYREVFTNGFVVAEDGEKMSKSLGNYISLAEGLEEFGADLLRLWFASVDVTGDVKVSRNLIRRSTEAYKKIRNTIRFLLGNLHGFDPGVHGAPGHHELLEVDRWALDRTERLLADVTQAYDAFRFNRVYRLVHEFCVTDMSAFYLDIVRDRLYTWAEDDPRRRGAQVVLRRVASVVIRLLAPILCHTAEEAWGHLEGDEADSVHLAPWPDAAPDHLAPDLVERWKDLRGLRDEVNRVIETLRKEKEVGSSLEAAVSVRSEGPYVGVLEAFDADELAALCIVSRFEVHEEPRSGEVEAEEAPGLFVVAREFDAAKCDRCWRRDETVGEDEEHPLLCGRCLEVVEALEV